MRTSKAFAVGLALAAVMSLSGRLSAGLQTQPKAAAEDRALPLVRMDLLEPRPPSTAPPGRNIFAPHAAQPARPVSVVPGNPLTGVLPAGGSGEEAVVPGAPSEAAAPPAFSLDLRFIGYVDSPKTRKIIGLVIFQGQARAVVEGEVISEGVRIGKIGREEIEVVLPDASTKTFSLEGEE